MLPCVYCLGPGDARTCDKGDVTTFDAKSPVEAGHVAVLGGGDERLEETSLLARIRRHPSFTSDVLASTGHHLPRVGLFEPKGIRDITI